MEHASTSVAGDTQSFSIHQQCKAVLYCCQKSVPWISRRGSNIMLPNIGLIVAAIFASVLLMTGGFWLVSTFRIAKTSAGVPPRRALPVDPTLTSGSENKQICVLAGSHGVNETSRAVGSPSTNARVSAAAGVIKSASQSRSEDTDQTSNVASRSRPMPAAAPVVALTEDVGPRSNVDAAITPTASADGRAVGGAIAAGRVSERMCKQVSVSLPLKGDSH